jgi:hypothetical protein
MHSRSKGLGLLAGICGRVQLMSSIHFILFIVIVVIVTFSNDATVDISRS